MENKLILCFIFALSFAIVNTQSPDCGNVPSNNNAYYFVENCDFPLTKNPAEDVVATSSLTFTLIAKLRGGSMTNYTNLYPGVTYTFTTCEENEEDCPKSSFNTVMVIRDPWGNVLQSNNDCEDCTTCYGSGKNLNSQIVYEHSSSLEFSWITISVFYYNPASHVQSCIATILPTGPSPRYVNLYHNADSSVQNNCEFLLVCNDDTVQIDSDDNDVVINVDTISAGSSDCGLDIDGTPTTFTCEDIGPNNVTLSLYDRSCVSVVTVEDKTSPSLVSCGSSDWFYSFKSVRSDVNIDPYCPPGEKCFAYVYAYLPPQLEIFDNCGLDNVTYFPTARDVTMFQPLGAEFSYNVIFEDKFGNRFELEDQECTYTLNGIHILDIEEDNVFEGEFYFLNTKYNISIEYYLEMVPEIDMKIALLSRAFNYLDDGPLIYADYEKFDVAESLFINVIFKSDEIPTGQYELLIEQEYTDFAGTQKGYSVGNPLVYITGVNLDE